MATKNYMQTLLADLGRTVGLEQLKLDENNYCCIVFDEKYYVSLDYDDSMGAVTLSCDLGKPDAKRLEELYGRLLQVNYFWKETNNETMSLDGKRGHIFQLMHLSVANLDLSRFQERLESFINSAEAWSNIIQMPGADREIMPIEKNKTENEAKNKYRFANIKCLA